MRRTRRVTDARLNAARALVMRYGWNAVSYQLLNPGMHRWFSRAGDAVVGYVPFGGTWVVAGAPVCAPERLATAAAELEADAAMRRARVLYFGAGERLERAYAARPDHSLVRLGAQPVWNPAGWADIVAHKSSLRAQVNRARNK